MLGMDRVAAVSVGAFGPLIAAIVAAVAVVQSVRPARRHERNQARRQAVEAWGEAHGLEPDDERPYLRGTDLHMADHWVAETIGRYGKLLGNPHRRFSVAAAGVGFAERIPRAVHAEHRATVRRPMFRI